MRIASYNVELSRKGPGLLLRGILAGDPQVEAVVQVIQEAAPDVLLLQSVDYDHGLVALTALRDRLAEAGLSYPHLFALRPNSGMATGLDLDGNGRLGEARDAQGYGRFAGQGGMALLSIFPIEAEGVQDLSALLWADLPDSSLSRDPAILPRELWQHQRLSSVGHWVIPLRLEQRRLWLLAFHATTPLFDGDEDRNGHRNADEIALWRHYLSGRMGQRFAGAPEGSLFVILGDANNDPDRGAGHREAMAGLLAAAWLQDPQPQSAGHDGLTVDWGNDRQMRVDYVLPGVGLQVLDSGVIWPDAPDPLAEVVRRASRHRLVWVEVQPVKP